MLRPDPIYSFIFLGEIPHKIKELKVSELSGRQYNRNKSIIWERNHHFTKIKGLQ